MQRAVLTQRMVLPGPTARDPALPHRFPSKRGAPICLCPPYAISSTDLAYGATRQRRTPSV
eukprot:361643-Rhodomonas_salina.3